MFSLLKALQEFNSSKDYVLAVIIDTKGSTYQKTGAMMLIDEQLNYWGLLSGGCLEGDISLHSESVFNQKQDKTLHYNMRDEADKLWGMGLGCDGEITVLLKYLPSEQQHFNFFSILDLVRAGSSHYLTIDKNDSQQINYFLTNNKPISLKDKKHWYLLKAPHHLLICGAAPDVLPITAIAHQIGWKTTIIDHRKAFADSNLFPLAEEVIHIKRSTWNDFDLSPFDSVVIMSHQFERDQSYLKKLLASSLKYIGLLGPSKRRDKLFEECESQFSEHQGRVFAPIGLDIGADSPETIALAIVSEIHAVINNKNNCHCYQDQSR